jgi:hypothetical protein
MESALAAAATVARTRVEAPGREASLPSAMAEELAVLGTEVARRHALAAATALAAARRR